MGGLFNSRLILRAVLPAAAVASLIAGAALMSSTPAQAKKCISEATGFPCKKCHNSAQGGKEEGWNAYGTKYKAKMKGHYPC